MIRPQHISLKHRSALAGRLFGLPAMHRKASELTRGNSNAALVSLRKDLDTLTRAALKGSDSIQLDTFLKGLSRDLHNNAKTWLRQSSSNTKLLKSMMSDVQRQMGLVCCATCAGSKARICKGRNVDEDAIIVGQSGQCIAPLMEIFRAAEKISRSCYKRFAKRQLSKKGPKKIFLFTQEEGDKPHEFDLSQVPYNVSGLTSFHSTPKGSITIVTLLLWVREFDWDTYLACPYVFMHELICHAFSNFRHLSEESKHPDLFAEGWMDWVAYLILEEHYRKSGFFPTRDKGQVKVAQTYHEGRMNFHHEKAPEVCADWAKGKEAAEKVHFLLQKLVKAYPEEFFKLSFQFNVMPYPWHTREEFITTLNSYLPYEGEYPENQAKYDKLVGFFRKFFKSNGLDRMNQLVTEVLTL